ncbi:hypothetical protein FBU31_006955, partial [Coemansia sp. 'formosensis']
MGKSMYYEHEPTDLDPRREKLVRELENRGHSVEFPELVVKLGLVNAWIAYEENVTVDTFESLADDLLVVRPTNEAGSSENKVYDTEAAYVDTFQRLLLSLSVKAKDMALPVAYHETPYIHKDNQARTVKGTKLKPDLAFYQRLSSTRNIQTVQFLFEAKRPMKEDTAFGKYLGQFADYVLEVWKNQPLRTFVPLLLLLGCELYLVVFTREGYYRTTIGQVLYPNGDAVKSDVFDVGLALRNLWFLLTLPVSQIGQLNT